MKLAEVRARKFLSQSELAKQADVGISTINAIERGRELPTPRTVRKLAAALELDDPMGVDEFKASFERSLGRQQGKAKGPGWLTNWGLRNTFLPLGGSR